MVVSNHTTNCPYSPWGDGFSCVQPPAPWVELVAPAAFRSDRGFAAVGNLADRLTATMIAPGEPAPTEGRVGSTTNGSATPSAQRSRASPKIVLVSFSGQLPKMFPRPVNGYKCHGGNPRVNLNEGDHVMSAQQNTIVQNKMQKHICNRCLVFLLSIFFFTAGLYGGERAKRHVKFVYPARTYKQIVTIKFSNEEAAKKATVQMAPLYDGFEWSMSSRWDDNNPADLKMRDVLESHGHKGTFYFNARNFFGLDSASSTSIARKLLKGGNSIGSHGWTHPFLSYYNLNGMFEETLRCRVYWEAAIDTLITSYAASYGDYGQKNKPSDLREEVTHILERGGYYGVPNGMFHRDINTDMVLMPCMPADGAEIDDFVQKALDDKDVGKNNPHLSYSVHVLYSTPEAWEKFEGQLNKYGNNPNWWYCNQNEYAAYRCQYFHSKLTQQRIGKNIEIQMIRPEIIYLNNSIPLTISIKGVDVKDIVSVESDTAECVRSERHDDEYYFHLQHNRDQKLPGKIGLIANEGNRSSIEESDQDSDFPGLRGLLHKKGDKLHLTLHNQTGSPLTELRVTFRLPLAWDQGVIRRSIASLKPGVSFAEDVELTRSGDNYLRNAGREFLIAQLDFNSDGKAGRIYFTCRTAAFPRDPSYPQGGFLRLGPAAGDTFDPQTFVAALGSKDKSDTAMNAQAAASGLRWQDADIRGNLVKLNPELILTTGVWWGGDKAHEYVLWGRIDSPIEQEASFIFDALHVDHLTVNGRKQNTGSKTKLNKGVNTVVILYHTIKNAYGNAACGLRVVKPGTSERITNIKYRYPLDSSSP